MPMATGTAGRQAAREDGRSCVRGARRRMGLRFTPHCRRWAAALVIWNELLRSGMQVVLQSENASGELWSMRWTEIGG